MFKEIQVNEISKNAFTMYPNDWALLSAGNEEKFNTMTISWGGFGHLWRRDIAYIYVRPTRYTYEFIEKEDYFTLSFFNGDFKIDLGYLGKFSGRNEDKISKTNLNTMFIEGIPCFEQAEYVILCKKVHSVDITREQFMDKDVEDTYTDDNLHRQYIGVIEKVYKKD